MKKQLITMIFFFSAIPLFAENITIPAGKTTVSSYSDAQVSVSDGADLHLTSQTPLTNSTITLQTENSWLFFDSIRPNVVISNYLQFVKIGNSQAAAVNNSNVRVEIYVGGAVVIPQPSNATPLQVFDGQNFSGDVVSYSVARNTSLGAMDNKIRSFKLKRGYMATLATMASGLGYSRVFIADGADLEIPVLQPELDQTVSFIRVTKWFYTSKKGWCSSGGGRLNEIDLTASTWWYSWSATASNSNRPNQEYVPIKQKPGWPSSSEILGVPNVNHVLHYNEPDKSDQANATVEQAIADMPELLATGYRIGSPAIADNLTWLYSFVDECERLNYRLDFVAIHAYWGGAGGAYNTYTNGQLDINKWYNRLKEIHDRVKRPLWITEWNNGANWTSESWPSGTEAQQQKQLADLQKIINMMDTCSFIERYSIYNWVEDKRALVMGTNSSGAQTAGGTINQYLTPAGEFYRDNHSAMAFNRTQEVIPTLTLPVPAISSFSLTDNNTKIQLNISTNDYSEIYESYFVEQKTGDGEYLQTQTISNQPVIDKITAPVDISKSGQQFFRIRAVDHSGNVSEPSNEVSFAVSPADSIQTDKLSLQTSDWTTIYFGKTFDANPVAVLGVPTNNNMSMLMSNRIRNISTSRLQFRFFPWSYITSSFYTDEEMSYLLLPQGTYNSGSTVALAGLVTSVNGDWKSVSFPENLFTSAPVIIPTQTTSVSASATSIHLRNVTASGFEICLRREDAKTYTIPAETVNFIAVSEGGGEIMGRKFRAGFGENVGNITARSVTVNFGETFKNPLIFAHKQTANNEFASNLRMISYTDSTAVIFNQMERSGNYNLNAPADNLGWIAIEKGSNGGTSIASVSRSNFTVFPNPASTVLYFNNIENQEVTVKIINLQGIVVKQKTGRISEINISALPAGMYLVLINGQSSKFIKK
ncbi:MAG: T9SS type A sorting domain-containing protein [Dysgonamonadaceae bacterium]|jgi:hypothetical protein|nr:T9SS type A sorting domain-containing protein [Dysgonamonadaceae bacterium]